MSNNRVNDTNEQREIRIAKLDQIRALGYDPFGQKFAFRHWKNPVNM